jgi:hypothetical protein
MKKKKDTSASRTYEEISPVMRAFIGTYEVFRRLGYAPDDLYASANMALQTDQMYGWFILQQEGKDFSIQLAPITSAEEFEDEYVTVAHIVSSGGVAQADLDRMYAECTARQFAVQLILALAQKGFRPETMREDGEEKDL